jgi:hypothetical protein
MVQKKKKKKKRKKKGWPKSLRCGIPKVSYD